MSNPWQPTGLYNVRDFLFRTEQFSEQTVNRKSAEPAENENKKTLVIRYGLILYLYQALTLFRLMSGSISPN